MTSAQCVLGRWVWPHSLHITAAAPVKPAENIPEGERWNTVENSEYTVEMYSDYCPSTNKYKCVLRLS